MGFWVETKTFQILVDHDVILLVHPSSKVSQLNKSAHYRLLKVVPNDSPTRVFYPHFIHNSILTKHDSYDMTSS